MRCQSRTAATQNVRFIFENYLIEKVVFYMFVTAPRDGLHNTRIDGGNEIDGGVKIFLGYT